METPIGSDISLAARILQSGGLVGIPTETVYGLAGHAFDAQAVAKIFAAKKRPVFDPLIVHIGDIEWLDQVATTVPDLAKTLMDKFWPGPLTLILEKNPNVADLVTSGLSTVAVRIPQHPLALELLQACQCPLAAPSANLFGRTSPTTAMHVYEQLKGRIDFILDGGPCKVGVESTIVQIRDDKIHVLRPGGVPLEQLKQYGPVLLPAVDHPEAPVYPIAPGQLKEHYAPTTPLVITLEPPVFTEQMRVGLLTLQKSRLSLETLQLPFECIYELSPKGDLTEASAEFFAAIHEMDLRGLDLIYANLFPSVGLGVALNDRLHRAAHS